MINVALIGLGRIGMMHAKNILDHKYLKFYTLSMKKIKFYQITQKGNSNVMFQKVLWIYLNPIIDIIFIASSTPSHIKFIDLGLKFKKTIFCEKPLDLDIRKN